MTPCMRGPSSTNTSWPKLPTIVPRQMRSVWEPWCLSEGAEPRRESMAASCRSWLDDLQDSGVEDATGSASSPPSLDGIRSGLALGRQPVGVGRGQVLAPGDLVLALAAQGRRHVADCLVEEVRVLDQPADDLRAVDVDDSSRRVHRVPGPALAETVGLP